MDSATKQFNWRSVALPVAAAIALCWASAPSATPVPMGTAGPDHWAVFCFDSTSVAVGSSTVAGVVGNVGIAPDGNCNIVKSTVTGNLIMNTVGSLSISLDSSVGGFVEQDAAADAILTQAAADARTAASLAAGLAATGTVPGGSVDNGTAFIGGGPGVNVFDITNFELTGGATLTLFGVPGSSFVFNISDTMHMADGSLVVLGGSLVPSDVLYNVLGTGKEVDIIKPSTTCTGVLLAPERDLKIDQAKVDGEVISGGSKFADNSRGAVDGSGCPSCPTKSAGSSWGRLKTIYRH